MHLLFRPNQSDLFDGPDPRRDGFDRLASGFADEWIDAHFLPIAPASPGAAGAGLPGGIRATPGADALFPSLDPVAQNGDDAPATFVGASGNPVIDGLLGGVMWSGGAISYSDPDAAGDYQAGYDSDQNGNAVSAQDEGFGRISADQLFSFRYALDSVGALSGSGGFSVEGFTGLDVAYAAPGSGAGTIRIANTEDADTAYAYYPGYFYGGDLWIGPSARAPEQGNYDWMTALHELGHSLGLKHGHEAGGPADAALPAGVDSLEFTVMSYRSYVGATTDFWTNGPVDFPQTFMMLDIAALQYMYGADFTTNATDTVYSWSETTGQAFVDGAPATDPAGNRIFMTIWDGGGTDTYDLGNFATDLAIDLRPGNWSVFDPAQTAFLGDGRHARGNLANALLHEGDLRSLIENAIGGSGNDTLTGNLGANSLSGGDGDDRLIGKSGDDELYGEAGADFVKAGSGADLVRGGSGGDRLIGQSGEDTLRADGGDDFAKGGSGDDAVHGDLGRDTLKGNAGNDTLFGGDDKDKLFGHSGDDLLWGEDGNDRLAGGSGADVLNGGEGDDYLKGGSEDDRLYGNADDDRLVGHEGADILVGGAGDDLLLGEEGDDRLRGGGGSDIFVFRGDFGLDEIEDFEIGLDALKLKDLRDANGGEALTFDQLLITQQGVDAWIELDLNRDGVADVIDLDGDGVGDQVRIELLDFDATTLTAADFQF